MERGYVADQPQRFDPLRLTLRAQPRSGEGQIRTLPEIAAR